jgi:hypothetical protein
MGPLELFKVSRMNRTAVFCKNTADDFFARIYVELQSRSAIVRDLVESRQCGVPEMLLVCLAESPDT